MKQLVFMIAATLTGTAGVYIITPFCGVFVYYLFAVLRPQYMWKWSLPDGIAWSYYVALTTISAAALALLGLIQVATRRSATAQPSHRIGSAQQVMTLFGFWIFVTYLTARDTAVAYFTFEEYLKIFLMYMVSAFLIRSTRQLWSLFVMTAVVLAYISYEINYQYFVNNYLGIYHNGYGGLDNNGAGLMLAMGVPLCWFCFEGFERWWRWAFVALIPVIVHAVLMTYSRGAMLSLVVACPFLLFRSRHRVQMTGALLAFGLVLVPMMAGPEITARFLTIQDNDVDDSANSRRQSWAAAWAMAKDNPVLGVGVRNANLFSQQYGADMYGRTIHSQYLQIAADNGFVGLAIYLAVFGTAWFSLCRCRRATAGRPPEESRQVLAIANGVECSLVVYCFGALFLSLEVFELPYLLLLLAAQLEVVNPATRPTLESDADDAAAVSHRDDQFELDLAH